MFNRVLVALLCLGLLASCDSGGGDVLKAGGDDTAGNGDDTTGGSGGDDTTGGDDGDPIDGAIDLLPGTSTPTRTAGIFRREAFDEEAGSGYARGFRYERDAQGNERFVIDGLAFDGSQPDGVPYERAGFDSLGRYALYEAPVTFDDPINGNPITQFQHRALYGVSDTLVDTDGDGTPDRPMTEFAIVRTGNYVEYGFGGFLYQRNNDVTLPTEGQAAYRGEYAGIRDFNGQGGLEYVTGDMQLDIDFGGFAGNCTGAVCGNAVRGYVRNRAILDLNGNDVTQGYLDALNTENGTSLTSVPTLLFRIGPNVMTVNGEITGEVFSSIAGETLETGNYYGILSGDHTTDQGQVVGVIVVESEDPRVDSVTVRETGGFIVNRPAPVP